jgi:dienelactone hydrolase
MHKSLALCCSLLLIATALPAAPKPAAKPAKPASDLEQVLAHEIVGPVLPLVELQRYCEPGVPRMKTFPSAAAWQAEASRLRAAMFERVVFRGAAARWRDAPLRVEWRETIAGGPGYRIKKLRYEAVPGMWIPALLYEPEKLAGRVPVIMNVNGHVGKPGKSVDYKQIRCINQAKRGMLALNVEWIGMGQLATDGFTHARMNQLDLCGTSGIAPFFLSMKHGLDLLLSLPNADPSRVAVTGLSGGGWQTIFISGLDPRVTLANPVAGYSSFITRTQYAKDLGDSEQTPCDMATVLDYTHLTAMRAPHATLLTNNAKDQCCFESGYALEPLVNAARPIFKLFGREAALRWHVNYDPGTHNYELDNRLAFYAMLGDFFYPGVAGFREEIPSDKEVKKFDELVVDLPTPNQDFHSLALGLAEHLPRTAAPPADAAALGTWRTAQLAKLRALVRAQPMQGVSAAAGSEDRGGLHAAYRKFALGQWTVPAVELTRGTPAKTALLVADGGRRAAAKQVEALLAASYRVVVADPLHVGESQVPGKGFLWMLTVATVGGRPLGIQACQLGAMGRILAAEHKQPVTLVSVGPRCGVTALVAAALEQRAIGKVELHDSLASLKDVLEKNWTYTQAPEVFCFGLLEQFDLPHLVAMVGAERVMKK